MEIIAREEQRVWPRGGTSRRQKRVLYLAMWVANAVLLLGNLALTVGWVPPVETLGMQISEGAGPVGGAWYPSMLLLLLGLAAIWHYLRSRRRPPADARAASVGWLLVGVLAVVMSADEVACLHEGIRSAPVAHAGDHFLGLMADWAIVLSPLTMACMALLVAFTARAFRDRPYPRRLAAAALVCCAGSLAIEFAVLSSWIGSAAALYGQEFQLPLEEAFELSGITLYLMALIELGPGQSRFPTEAVTAGSA